STTEVLSHQRRAAPAEACSQVVELLNKKIDPASIWDGLFLTAGELLMRQPGIVGLHCVTTVNALHFAYQASANDETRRLMLLQAAAFLPLFRKRMGTKLAELRLDTVEKAELPKAASIDEVVKEVFRSVGRDSLTAAKKTLTVLQLPG